MNLKEFFEKTLDVKITTFKDGTRYSFQSVRPRIVCNDGTTLSVQGSKTHYCSPRVDQIINYYEVEVGYPAVAPPESWHEYADGYAFHDGDDFDFTGCVYGWVPVPLVEEYIELHGGIDVDKTFRAVEP